MRFALIGLGFGATHLEWMSRCPSISVEAIGYHTRRDRAAALADRFGIGRITDDPLSLVAEAAIDAVAVVTPPDTHEEYATAALERGLTVLCDKPLAHDVAAATRLAELARRRGARTAVTFQWRTNPALRRLRELRRDGDLGPVFQTDLEFHHDFLAGPDTAWPWRHRRDRSGAGTLADQGVHLFDLLRWLAGGEWTVTGARGAVQWPRRVAGETVLAAETEDVAEVWLDATAARARILVSRVSGGHRTVRASLVGTEATATVVADPDDGSATLTIHRPQGTEIQKLPPHPMNPYQLLVETGPDGEPPAGFDDGLAAQLMLDETLSRMESTNHAIGPALW